MYLYYCVALFLKHFQANDYICSAKGKCLLIFEIVFLITFLLIDAKIINKWVSYIFNRESLSLSILKVLHENMDSIYGEAFVVYTLV